MEFRSRMVRFFFFSVLLFLGQFTSTSAWSAACVLLQGSTTTEITEISQVGAKTFVRPLSFDFMDLGKEAKQVLERRGFVVIEKTDRRAYGNLPMPRYEINFSVRCNLKEFPALFGGTRLVNLCDVQGEIAYVFQDREDQNLVKHAIATMADEKLQITDTKALELEMEEIPAALVKNLPKSLCR